MWKDDFSDKYGTTKNVKRLNKEIQEASDKNKSQAKIEKALSDVARGKMGRRS